ncbi:hypothetical protein CGZ97_18390 [Enemella evansiae]|nr:hypothetical protein CGZ97_18390 [Enemella evansiae]
MLRVRAAVRRVGCRPGELFRGGGLRGVAFRGAGLRVVDPVDRVAGRAPVPRVGVREVPEAGDIDN